MCVCYPFFLELLTGSSSSSEALPGGLVLVLATMAGPPAAARSSYICRCLDHRMLEDWLGSGGGNIIDAATTTPVVSANTGRQRD
jgi:hypothetical protein